MEGEGVKKKEWPGRDGAGSDRVAHVSLLAAAVEMNNAIGHALEETPSRDKKEAPLRPPCDGMKRLKDGAEAAKQNKPATVE